MRIGPTIHYNAGRNYIHILQNLQFKNGGYRDGVKRKRDKTGMDYTHGAVR